MTDLTSVTLDTLIASVRYGPEVDSRAAEAELRRRLAAPPAGVLHPLALAYLEAGRSRTRAIDDLGYEVTEKAWTDAGCPIYTAAQPTLSAEVLEALIWCSGADDFQSGGKAHAGWVKLCRPLIERGLAVVAARAPVTPTPEPPTTTATTRDLSHKHGPGFRDPGIRTPEPATVEPRVGDRVRVVAGFERLCFIGVFTEHQGDEGEVQACQGAGFPGRPFYVWGGNWGHWFAAGDLEVIKPPAPEPARPPAVTRAVHEVMAARLVGHSDKSIRERMQMLLGSGPITDPFLVIDALVVVLDEDEVSNG